MTPTTKKALHYAIVTLVGATVFLVPFIVNTSLFFPYITGKAFVFRTLVELATLLYIVLAIYDRSVLPRKSLILGSIAAFTIVLGLATLHAEDPLRSFWSNFERMEGYVTILHLFFFFIVATSVFRTKKAWYALLNTSLVASVLVGMRAFADYDMSRDSNFIAEFFKGIKYFFLVLFGNPTDTVRIAGTLGNSSYLGGYALVHIFIAGLLFVSLYKMKNFKSAPYKLAAYALAIIFNIIVLYNTGTRGSFVGLVAGVFISVLIPLCIVLAKRVEVAESTRKLTKKIGIAALIVIIAAVSFLGIFKDSSFVKKSDLLSRFSSLITLDVKNIFETQGKARTLLWGMSWKGVEERPILGWGQDNFIYVFSKYYDPEMYAQEQWFDRTHNVFFDWLIAGGFLGLIGYLALFFALIFTLWKKTKLDEDSAIYDVLEKAILTGLLTAYFVHNLFIFDNLVSYILFFILLAYVNQRHEASRPAYVEVGEVAKTILASIAAKMTHHARFVDTKYGRIVLVIIAVGLFGYVSNEAVLKPYMAGKTLIKALQVSHPDAPKYYPAEEVTPMAILSVFEKALSYDTFANTEIRERLTEIAPNILNGIQDPTIVRAYTTLIADQYEKAIRETPNDPRPFVFLSIYLQKFGLYDQALVNMDRAIELSPTKQSFIFQKGVIYFTTKQFDKAEAVFKEAYELEKTNPEAKVLYALSLIYSKKLPEAKQVLGDDLTSLTDQRILEALLQQKHFDFIIEIANKKIAANPNDPQSHMSLAGLYLQMGRRADAVNEIRKVIELAPDFKDTGEYYIKEIQAGRDPSKAAQ